MDSNYKTLKQILENEPEDIDVPLFGTIKVKLPTTRDKLMVKETLTKIPNFTLLSEREKIQEESRILALKILIEPSLSIENYLDAPDLKVSALLDSVAMWYTLKLKNLELDRKGQIDSFLLAMKEK